MVHTLRISGDADGNVSLILDDGDWISFDTKKQINAQDIYDSLRYSPYDTYKLDVGDAGKVAPKAFGALADLYKQIVDGINAIRDPSLNPEDSFDAVSFEGVDQSPTTGLYDEDIPF